MNLLGLVLHVSVIILTEWVIVYSPCWDSPKASEDTHSLEAEYTSELW